MRKCFLQKGLEAMLSGHVVILMIDTRRFFPLWVVPLWVCGHGLSTKQDEQTIENKL